MIVNKRFQGKGIGSAHLGSILKQVLSQLIIKYAYIDDYDFDDDDADYDDDYYYYYYYYYYVMMMILDRLLIAITYLLFSQLKT